jgi:hypothetical protein
LKRVKLANINMASSGLKRRGIGPGTGGNEANTALHSQAID